MAKINGKQEEVAGIDLEHELPAGEGDENSPELKSGGSAARGGSGIERELQGLKAERDSLLDRLARAQAEFDNARKRAAKDQMELRDYAVADSVKTLFAAM